MYLAWSQVPKRNSHPKQTGCVPSWRASTRNRERYALRSLRTRHRAVRADRPPLLKKALMLQVAALNSHSPRLGHRIPETSRPLELPSSREQSQEWSDSSPINSVPTPVCLQLLSLIFKPLKTEQETLRIPHAETANVLHNKAVVIKRYFLHNAFRDLSPLPLNNIRSYDSGFQQLRWSKNVYTKYRNNPCLSKLAKMKTSSSDLHRPSQVCLT